MRARLALQLDADDRQRVMAVARWEGSCSLAGVARRLMLAGLRRAEADMRLEAEAAKPEARRAS